MSKPVAAVIERDTAGIEAAVRSAYSSLREAETQAAKAEKKLEVAQGAAQMRRLELGKALIEARKLWPARGPNAKGWGAFLEREGIEQSTAWRMMRDAGMPEDGPTDDETAPRRVSMQAGAAHENSAPDRRPTWGMEFRHGFDLRLGAWDDALRDIGEVDALIVDPPFGRGTHEGAESTRSDGSDASGLAPAYAHWDADDVHRFVWAWAPRVRGWMACMTSHDLIPAYQAAYEAAGRYAFAPVPCVIRGMTVRLRNDGPSSWTVYLMVSRPRTAEFASWGTLPGAYVGPSEHGAKGGRGKPRWLMDAIVSDYSRELDLVCDPMAGWGTTLFAALELKRRTIGAEIDPETHAVALERARITTT